jgi:hypothetical protein
MKLQTYTSTPGLEHFPKQERFAKWQGVHKQLLRDDVEYRKRFRSYLINMGCLTFPMVCVYGYYFGVGLRNWAANVAVIICVVPIMIYVAMRQMAYMNQRVGGYLAEANAKQKTLL